MKVLRPLVLLLGMLPFPAAAQRLAYEDLLWPEHRVAPRLAYAHVVDAAPRPAPISEEEGSVRAFYGDRFEWIPQPGADAYTWDMSAEIGGARDRLWLAFTGDGAVGSGLDYVEAQALYSRPLGDSGFSLQAGVRRDFLPHPRRSYAALGLQGNVTDPLYVGAFGFLSHRGEFTARGFAYYDLALTENLILQPAAEMEIAAADVPELGIGAGPVYAEAGLRLRYRLHEAFSPYVGVNWERLLGRTARMAREEGEEVQATNLVLGVRSYF
jgi:copper resistance protein B